MTTSTPCKAILGAGLGPYAAQIPDLANTVDGATINAVVADNMRRASEHGFDCEHLVLNPFDPAGAADAFKKALGERCFDGVVIGYGLKTSASLTPLLEIAVNACREMAPGARIMFDHQPGAVWDAIQRVFPDAAEGSSVMESV